jgi:hypothetical protein
MSLKIVFIGCSETPQADQHILKHREAGDVVCVADPAHGEQMVRRIIDADEVHLFEVDRDDAFELGMVYFFAVHALHYKLHWKIKVFNCCAEVVERFIQHEPKLEAGEKDARPILMDIKVVPTIVRESGMSIDARRSKENLPSEGQ